MIDRLKDISLFKPDQVAGVSLNLKTDGSYDYSLVILKREKSLVSIEKENAQIDNIEDLIEEISASVPVTISIDGKGVLHKKVRISENDGDVELLKKVFPNATLKDFYIQKENISDKEAFVSVVRKEIIDNIIEEFAKSNRFLVGFSLGAMAINDIVNIIDDRSNVIITDNYNITITQESITEIERISGSDNDLIYSIGKDRIRSKTLVPFANAFRYLIRNGYSGIDVEKVKSQEENFFYKKVFVIAGWSVLLLLFAILLVNYFCFDHYNNKQNVLSGKVAQNEGLLTILDTLNKEIVFKEEFIKKSGFLISSRHSFYSDRIANSVSKKILLSKLEVFPLKKKMKEGKKPEFVHNIIKVGGHSKNSFILNDWVKTIKEEEWVSDVEIIRYNQEDRRKSGEFELEIIMK